MKLFTKTEKNKSGMTLIEILLYLSISAGVLLTISVFITAVLRARVKNESITLVNEEAVQIISQFEREIADADIITQPTEGTSAATLGFQVVGDPVETITLQTDTIVYTLTGNPEIDLNSTNTNVTSLSFTRMNTISDNESIKIEFTLERNNINNLNEYEYSKTFYTTININRKTGEPETYI